MASDTNKRVSASERAASAASSLQDKVVDAATDAAAGAGEAAASVAETAGSLYGKATEHAKAAISAAPASRADAEHLLLRGRQRVHRGVRHQPVEALLLAGAIGYLVGWATSRG